jgi:hypothetical protein
MISPYPGIFRSKRVARGRQPGSGRQSPPPQQGLFPGGYGADQTHVSGIVPLSSSTLTIVVGMVPSAHMAV